jgi:hypothetical protein
VGHPDGMDVLMGCRHGEETSTNGVRADRGGGVLGQEEEVCIDRLARMATVLPSESTPQRVAAVREQLKLLSDYL